MKSAGAFLICLALAGCADLPWNQPSLGQVDRLEQVLAGQPCIGNLAKWERRYMFAPRPDAFLDEVNRQKILFQFFEAGVDGFTNRRLIQSVDEMMLYHGEADFTHGEFDIEKAHLSIDSCSQVAP